MPTVNTYPVITTLLGLLVSLLAVGTVQAATSSGSNTRESITLSPTSKVYKMDAGSTKSDKLTIVNDGETDYTFTVYTSPYSVKDEEYGADFTTLRTNTDIESWVRFEKTSFFIRAGETLEVPYVFAVPPNASPGGHYGVIFAEAKPTLKLDQTGVERRKRVGAIIYATVNGSYKTGGEILIFDTQFFQFKPPIKAFATVENSGNADFETKTSFVVSDMFGNKKFEASKDYRILPQTSRKLTLEWTDSPGLGLFKVESGIQFLDKTETKTAYVLIAPLWAYLVLGVALFGVVVYLITRRK